MSLYNSERPQTLDQVIGQRSLKAQLIGMLQQEKLPNALLFVGPRGTGKTTVARIVAKRVNCASPKGSEPCNECASCKAIMAGNSPDVDELDAASHNKVEDARELLQRVGYAPLGNKKVFILDEVHMFSTGAWNALLKAIEEPPEDVLFVLCTTEENKVPATIISRCRKCNFEKIELSEILELLKSVCDKHMKAYEEDALKMIARASEGCVRDSLSIMEAFFEDRLIAQTVAETLGLAKEDMIFAILNGIQDGDIRGAIKAFQSAQARGASMQQLLKSLMEALTDAIFALNGADKSILNTEAYREQLKAFVAKADAARCMELVNCLSGVYQSATRTADAAFLVESALISTISQESELSSLKRKVEELASRPVIQQVVAPQVAPVEVSVKETPVAVQEAADEGFIPFEDEDSFVPDEWNVALSETFASIESEQSPVIEPEFSDDAAIAACVVEHAQAAAETIAVADDDEEEVLVSKPAPEKTVVQSRRIESPEEIQARKAGDLLSQAQAAGGIGGLPFMRSLFSV